LLSDTAYVIQQIRLASLNSDGPIAERVIQMPATEGAEENSFFEITFEPAVNDNDSFFSAPRASKAKRAQMARQLAQDLDNIEKGAPEPANGVSSNASGKPADLSIFSSSSSSGLSFEKVSADSSKKPPVSTLSNLIMEKSGIKNPFLSYSSYCGKGEAKPITLKIWLPFSENKKKPMEVIVKRDATVGDVIGYALYQYIDDGRTPAPLSSLEAYSLRIVEDDGVIDDDFPALERSRKIEKFSFDQFALVEQNREKFLAAENAKKQAAEKASQKKSGHIFLKIHLYSTLEIKHTTSISAPLDEKLEDLLKRLCKKNSLPLEHYTLRLADTKTDISLDKTVGEANVSALCLLKKNQNSAGDIYVRPTGEKAGEDAMEAKFSNIAMTEFSAFKKYTVMRKMPMFGTKQERILAFDGSIIHNLPSENKAIFDSSKTSSFNASDILSCEHKGQNWIRITFKRDQKDAKVYDFELQSPEETDEIIHRLNFLTKRK